MLWYTRYYRLGVMTALLLGTLPRAGATPRCHELVISGNPAFPPYLWQQSNNDKVLQGVFTYLLNDISHLTDIKISVVYSGPWGRVQKNAATGDIDAIMGIFYTPERAEYMDYLKPEVHITGPSVIVNQRVNQRYQSWDDLKGKQGISIINNSLGYTFDQFAKENLTIHLVPTIEQALKMLSYNRADYFIYEYNAANAYMKRLGINNLTNTTITINQSPLFLAISKKSKCNNRQTKEVLQHALQKINNKKDLLYPLYLFKAYQVWSKEKQGTQTAY